MRYLKDISQDVNFRFVVGHSSANTGDPMEDCDFIDVVPTLDPPDDGRFGCAGGNWHGSFVVPANFDGSEPIFKELRQVFAFTIGDYRNAVAHYMREAFDTAYGPPRT